MVKPVNLLAETMNALSKIIHVDMDASYASVEQRFEYFCTIVRLLCAILIALPLKTWRATVAIRGPEEGFPLVEVDNMGALFGGASAQGAKTDWRKLGGGSGIYFVKISRIALEAAQEACDRALGKNDCK